MKAFITGVAGFVGSSIADRLLEDGFEVVGIDSFVPYYARSVKESNLTKASDYKNFKFIEGDLADVDLKKTLDGVGVIYHQAGQAGVRASWGAEFQSYIHNNIHATQRLLEVVKDLKQIKKLVFASSSSVYGDAESFPTSEKIVPKPVSPYGVTKLASEHLMTLYASQYGVPTVSLRYFTVFGPRQRPDMAFNKFTKAALTNSEITIYGDGSQSRDFTYIDDIVDANLLAAEHGQAGDVFNIGGGTQATVNQVLQMLKEIAGDLKVRYTERQLGDAKHTRADTSFAKSNIKFSPKISLREGLRREFEWGKQVF